MTDSKALVDKLWNYCNVLRDDGLSYGDYVCPVSWCSTCAPRRAARPQGWRRPQVAHGAVVLNGLVLPAAVWALGSGQVTVTKVLLLAASVLDLVALLCGRLNSAER